MNRLPRRLMMPIACAALAGALMIAYDASGLRAMAAAPTRIALVRMKALTDNLRQEAANIEQLKAMQSTIEQETMARGKEVEDLRKELNDKPDAPDFEEKFDSMTLKYENLRRWRAATDDKLKIERALRIEDLLAKIDKAIAEIAELQGYDLVMIDDGAEEPVVDPKSNDPDSVQRAQQLMQRRILYRVKTIDITDDLAVRMNNAFKAGGN